MLKVKDLDSVGQSKLCKKLKLRVGCLPHYALTNLPLRKAFSEQKNSSHKEYLLNQTGQQTREEGKNETKHEGVWHAKQTLDTTARIVFPKQMVKTGPILSEWYERKN